MIPTDDEDAYLLAMGFDKMLDVGYDSGVPFFMSTLVKFISLNPKNGVSLKSVFECKHIYSWYYGSTLTVVPFKLLGQLISPHLFRLTRNA